MIGSLRPLRRLALADDSPWAGVHWLSGRFRQTLQLAESYAGKRSRLPRELRVDDQEKEACDQSYLLPSGLAGIDQAVEVGAVYADRAEQGPVFHRDPH